jgi:hypothetical protein
MATSTLLIYSSISVIGVLASYATRFDILCQLLKVFRRQTRDTFVRRGSRCLPRMTIAAMHWEKGIHYIARAVLISSIRSPARSQ